MSDMEGIFEDSLLSLFQHRPIAFSTAGPSEPYIYRPSTIRYLSNGSPVRFNSSTSSNPPTKVTIPVNLPTAPSALHTTLQLTHIWLSSILMADLILSGAISVLGQRTCELGAGAGLPGIVAMQAGARAVVSTDYAVPAIRPGEGDGDGDGDGDDVLSVLRGNFRRSAPSSAHEGAEWKVLGHTWGQPVHEILASCTAAATAAATTEPFPVLLLADLLWATEAHEALITSILGLISPEGTAHLVAGLHQGRGAVERFKRSWLVRTVERGGWVREMMEVQWGLEGWECLRDFRGKDSVAEEREGADEHGTVVWFTVGTGHDR